MIGAIAASQAAGSSSSESSDSSSNATAAVVTGAMALMAQRQINYTRSNESEADRVGIQTLARSGYEPNGMADFFERMQKANRGNSGGYQVPEYLRSHPVTSTRISETRQRAEKLAAERPAATGGTVRSPSSLLLPGIYSLGGGTVAGLGDNFGWVRERLRVLSAEDPAAALREYRALARAPGARTTDAQRYGLALAQLRGGYPAEAEATLDELLLRHPHHLWLELARAEAAAVAGRKAVAGERFDALLARHPDSRPVRLTYAQALGETATPAAGRRAQEVLRPLLASSAEDPVFQRSFARASELAGRHRSGRRGLCRIRLPQRPRGGRPQPAGRADEARRPGLLPARPHRGPHGRHHAGGAGDGAPGHPPRGTAARPPVGRGAGPVTARSQKFYLLAPWPSR